MHRKTWTSTNWQLKAERCRPKPPAKPLKVVSRSRERAGRRANPEHPKAVWKVTCSEYSGQLRTERPSCTKEVPGYPGTLQTDMILLDGQMMVFNDWFQDFLVKVSHPGCPQWNADECAAHSHCLPTPSHYFYWPDSKDCLCTSHTYWPPLCHPPCLSWVEILSLSQRSIVNSSGQVTLDDWL